jgi:hypothetical protein
MAHFVSQTHILNALRKQHESVDLRRSDAG